MTSRPICWASIPLAAVYSASSMPRPSHLVDGASERVVQRADHLLVGLELAHVLDQRDHLRDRVDVGRLERALRDGADLGARRPTVPVR